MDNLSLDIKEGEIFCLTGPDGAGKSTLIRTIATLQPLDSGQCFVLEHDVRTEKKTIRNSIGYMPDKFSLYPDLSIDENIRFYASIFGMTQEQGKALIEPIYCMLEPFGKRKAGKLSGGMKQKLALCCALIHRPKLLLLDEPTTGIDAVSRMELWQMLVQLNKQYGITIVASTPYRNEVMLAHRIAMMDHGQVLQVGKPQDLMPEEATIQRDEKHISDEYAIQVTKLTKQFGDFTAVKGITFNVKKGEIFGFLGANGAGKTTAIRMLCGLSVPSDGYGHVAGCDIQTETELIKQHIGYMSQKFALYQDLTIKENLLFAAGVCGIGKREALRRTEEHLKEMGFEGMGDRIVSTLPLGWKQKLAFVVATLHHPDIVFLDEPTSGVDTQTRHQIWETIIQTAEKGMTIFVTTHYMDEAMHCDRISIMVDGQIKALGRPNDLIQEYGAKDINDLFFMLTR